MAVPVSYRVPAFAYTFTHGHHQLVKDRRMTGEAWRVLELMIVYVEYETNQVKKPISVIANELGLQRQSVNRAIRLLRMIGAILPSQAWGKYHLSAELVFRGDLHLHRRLLQQQGIHKR